MRNFWKYNIGDEIMTRTAVYQIIDRNVWQNDDEEVSSVHERSRVKYLLWDREEGVVSEMSECDIDRLLDYPSATRKTKVDSTVNVTVKKNDANVSKQDNPSDVKSDSVNHPKYYQGNIEVIDFIEDKKLGFNLGNCVKYISRAGKKSPEKLVEDLKKARWYLDREIHKEEQKHGHQNDIH